MENLIFSLNVTIPIFLLIVIGWIFRRIGVFNEAFVSRMNKFVFLIPLPVLLFKDLAESDFMSAWDGKYVLFCFVVTLISIFIAVLISIPIKNKGMRGEFIQAAYRSSAAILGIAFVTNIYGSAAMSPLMIIGTVPLYNIFAVLILTLTAEDDREDQKITAGLVLKIAKGIVTNPIIIGIAAGFLWSALKLPYPTVMQKTVGSVSQVATPLGLMAMGGAFEFRSVRGVLKPAVIATAMKLVGFTAVFMPVAIALGFRESELVGILIMLGSASTVTCYTMAVNMKHDGALSSVTVSLTTLLSAFTLTIWLFIIKTMGYV